MMKKHIIPILLFAGLTCIALDDAYFTQKYNYSKVDAEFHRRLMALRYEKSAERSIPINAAVGDIIGIGRVTNAWHDTSLDRWIGSVDLVVDEFWRGNPGTNSFTIPLGWYWQPPVTNTPLVFFLTKYPSYREGSYKEHENPNLVRNMFNMDEFRARVEPKGLWFLGSENKWFHVTDENADLFAYASNLVFAVESNDMHAFYRTMRDGMNNHPIGTPMFDDSCLVLERCVEFMSREFIQRIWKDPNFPTAAWSGVKFYYSVKYKENLPIESASVIVIR